MNRRVLAVDWSGALKADRDKIWLCEVAGGEVIRLENGRSREELIDHLIEEAAREPRLVVGLDFAFSFPAQFLHKRAHREVATVWDEAARFGERWLEHCPFPFWGKPGKKRPTLGEAMFRETEMAVAEESGFRPFSTFQIGGAGAVGVGSVRGMPGLSRLRAAGFSIWPFDPPGDSLVVEIWPRLFMGNVRKSNRGDRARHLSERYLQIEDGAFASAEGSDDAFDALVSALEMDRHVEDFERLVPTRAASTALEGEIWRPSRR